MTPALLTPRWHWQPLADRGDAQAVACAWLATQGAPAEAICRTAHGRPLLPAPWDAGWSHADGGLLVALGRAVVLGVDMERMDRPVEALRLARRFFPPAECALLQRLDAAARQRVFVRLWCAREAVLKAHGRGLAFGMARLTFELDEDGIRLRDCDPALGTAADWRLLEFAPAPAMHAALAWRSAAY